MPLISDCVMRHIGKVLLFFPKHCETDKLRGNDGGRMQKQGATLEANKSVTFCLQGASPPGANQWNTRGLKSVSLMMLALLPVARMTYSPRRCAYASAACSTFKYATAP